MQNFLILAKDLDYISLDNRKRLGEKSKEVAQLINGLIRATEKQINK